MKDNKIFDPGINLSILFLVLIAMIISVINLSSPLSILGEDYGMNYQYPDFWFNLSRFAWDGNTGIGKPSVTSTINFVWSALIFGLSSMGISEWWLPRLVYLFFFIGTSIGAFLFLHNINQYRFNENNRNVSNISALVGSLVYTYSTFVMAMIHHPIYSYHFFIFLFPWIMLCVDRVLTRGISIVNIILLSMLLTLLANSNPAQVILIVIFMFIYFSTFSPKDLRFTWHFFWKYIVSVILLTTLLTAHFWLPIAAFMIDTAGANPYGEVGSQLASFIFNSRRGDLINTFTATSYPWLRDVYGNNYDINISLLILGFVTFLASIVGLFFRGHQKLKLFWLATMLISVFLAKGYQQPFGDVWVMAIEHFPTLSAFRAVVHKFYLFVHIAICVLVNVSLLELSKVNAFKTKTIYFLAALLVISVFLHSYPLVTGKLIEPDYFVQVPEEYAELRDFYDKQVGDERTLALPATPRGAGSVLNWGDSIFIGPHILSYMNKSYVDAAWFIQNNYFNTVDSDWWDTYGLENNMDGILDSLWLLGIGYIYVQKDSFDEFMFNAAIQVSVMNQRKKSSREIKYLEENTDYKLVLDTDHYAVYKVSQAKTGARFYVPSSVLVNIQENG